MTLGSIVLYVTPDNAPRAAVVTATHAEDASIPDDGTASLAVFGPTALEIVPRVPRSDTPQAGCWSPMAVPQ